MTNNNNNHDYSTGKIYNGKIYKIVSPHCDKVYYGSTICTLKERESQHLTDHCTSRLVIQCGDYDMKEVEAYPCASRAELEDREAEYIKRDWDGCVNKIIPGAVRRAGGKKAYHIQYYKDNREKILAYQKEYSKDNREKIFVQRKQYREDNREKILARKKQYREDNKQRIRQHQNQKVSCECCSQMIKRSGKARHQRTTKCQKHVQNELAKLMEEMVTTIEKQQ